ncbi:hypothetical protein BUZ62_12280, partial [Staphylococcus pasteuri]|uniref:hypothetical protein n=1 Tax=Staphylococcus pasteuri TaxID=45972 RepID=UPI000D4204D1
MTKSTWKEDLEIEKEISKFMDYYFYCKLYNLNSKWKLKSFERIEDMSKQNNGIDVEIQFYNSKIKKIDEKAAAKYFNKNLKTFALESTYEKYGILIEGWLFGDKYSET